MRILNLYAGIGGNRKLWGDEHEITAVENVSEIAKIYQDFFPNDKVIIADAHQYLLEHFEEYDFIWSSPPCPTHSILNNWADIPPSFPDMKLYEEIIFLKQFFIGKWCVENVVSYYPPLIPPQKMALHYFWTNFLIRPIHNSDRKHYAGIQELSDLKGFDLSAYKGIDKTKLLRNCVEPMVGKRILDYAINPIKLQKELNL